MRVALSRTSSVSRVQRLWILDSLSGQHRIDSPAEVCEFFVDTLQSHGEWCTLVDGKRFEVGLVRRGQGGGGAV